MTYIAHEPTEATREAVKALTSFGNTQEQICTYLNIDDKTLHKYYRRELDTAVIEANAMVARKLFHKATEQDDLSAQTFWLKTRGKWRTADKIDEANRADNVLDKMQAIVEKIEQK